MLMLLLGSDDFSKREFIDSLVKDKGADLAVFSESDQVPNTGRFLETDLFSKPKVFVLQNIMPELTQADIEKLIATANNIVISVKALDKRKKENKELLLHKKIVAKEFTLPHGRELNEWIVKRVAFYGAVMDKDAVDLLAVRLGRDNGKETKIAGKVISVEEVFDLWQADSEIRKLIAFRAKGEINETDVKELVSENEEVDVFDLTNALADNQKQKAMGLLQRFLKEQTGSDEKTGIIQLNALLSEQFRNVAAVQDFLAAKKSENQILEITGWKPGRLFVIKKIAAKFKPQTVLATLSKLEALDDELKSSSIPPRVLLDLILSQLLA